MKEFILFVLSYLVIFLGYQLFVVRPAKKHKKKKQPTEIKYLVSKYNLDMKKVEYNQLLQIVALVSSFDIALVCSLIMIPTNFLLRLLVGLFGVVITILVSYHLVYLFYKKKGMIKHE